METPLIIDNVNRTLADDLRKELQEGDRLSIAASCFSIYAYAALKDELSKIDELRFIFTAPTFNRDDTPRQQREFYIPKLNRERGLYGSEFEIRLRNQLTQKAIARECADWIRKKVRFKSALQPQALTGQICLRHLSGTPSVYQPISEFTASQLGIEKSSQIISPVIKFNDQSTEQLLRFFNNLWKNEANFQDVTDAVIESMETVYKENAPEFIYFVTLYHIFHEFLEDLSEDVLPNEATGFKQSVIWNKLYNFQKDAALAIINKLEKYNGCILADSVGLGKTFTALAVIKYYENRNKSVLVLCPKKLNDNWIAYRSNYVNNPLTKDRLRYDILFHTDLSRKGGTTNGLNLAQINWGNYDLVVIDESHNFRNGGKSSTNEKNEKTENRYLTLMNKVMKEGVKTKVLMLSATPVNNRFNDLKNQLELAYEGDAANIDDLLDTKSSINDIFRQAQAAYTRWSKQPKEKRTLKALQEELSFDFFKVLDAVTIARSRKHIANYYSTAEIGSFPERLPPISVSPKLTDLDSAINYGEIFSLIQSLNLAIYTPSDFIMPSKAHKYGKDEDTDPSEIGLTRSGREQGIRRLMCTNLLKRLESSVNSFLLTTERIRDYISATLQKIENYQAGAYVSDEPPAAEDFDVDEGEDEVFIGRFKGKILLDDLDYVAWAEYLDRDLSTLDLLISMVKDIDPSHDLKLVQLKAHLKEKIEHPFNGTNRKILIFTAFSDTAEYLYAEISPFIKDTYGLNTALVTGQGAPKTTLKPVRGVPLDFNTVLSLFSPLSKERDLVYPRLKEQNIDILIATDCISEGQNLQDCDYLINFDIHWNPVRLIQRFGRIDRIGSQNKTIQMVNYWPDISLDEYIKLKARVESRMKASVLTSTGDDNLLNAEEQNDLDYRKEQLQKLRKEVVDLEDMNTGVSIMDLGLNEFRLDLLAYMKDNHDIEHTPSGLHAIVPARNGIPGGVIFTLKNRNPTKVPDAQNRLYPFYLVYITYEGQIFINHLSPKDILDRYRLLCKGQSAPIKELCRAFNGETWDGKRMGTYSKLLNLTIDSIVSTKNENDLSAFFKGSQGTLFTGTRFCEDDFELISFLIIRNQGGVHARTPR